MAPRPPLTLPRRLLHGTKLGLALPILEQGFALHFEWNGRYLGNGVYLTAHLDYAALWGPAILECEVAEGLRVFWLPAEVDADARDRVVRRFGREALRIGPAFLKSVPVNKTVTLEELATLCAIIRKRSYKFWRIPCGAKRGQSKRLFEHFLRRGPWMRELRRRGFDAISEEKQDPEYSEYVILAPDKVRPVRLHLCEMTEPMKFKLKPLPPEVCLLLEHERHLDELAENLREYPPEECNEPELRRSQLRWLEMQREWVKRRREKMAGRPPSH